MRRWSFLAVLGSAEAADGGVRLFHWCFEEEDAWRGAHARGICVLGMRCWGIGGVSGKGVAEVLLVRLRVSEDAVLDDYGRRCGGFGGPGVEGLVAVGEGFAFGGFGFSPKRL